MVVVLAGLVGLLPQGASAQNGPVACALEIREVREDFTLGRFQRVLDQLEPCRDARDRTVAERTEILSFLARTYLVLDDEARSRAAVEALLGLAPTYAVATTDPPSFRQLVAAVRRESVGDVVSSVSKTPERLREAPATVMVITADEIAHRGYLDLEALLHDLPGFDITRGVGTMYSNIYQRGYRSDTTDRTLFLIDGVENNDVWSNIAYLSRQFPLSNIERVEVIHGPASTMYGPNAFVGVINVVTRAPASYFRDDRRFAVRAQAGGGSWNTQFADATVAARSKNRNVAFALTLRRYTSDEMDRTGFEAWDFDDFDVFDSVSDNQYATALGVSDPALIAEARRRDQEALGRLVDGHPWGFSNETNDRALFLRLDAYQLQVGVQTWRREEGITGWYQDTFRIGARGGADNGNVWIPEFFAAYLKYNWSFRRLGFRLFSQFVRHEVDGRSRVTLLQSFANGDLSLRNLRRGDPAYWRTDTRAESSRQLRNELTVVYRHSPRFSLVSGLEVRSSSLQGDFLFSQFPVSEVSPELAAEVTRRTTRADVFEQLDVGLYAQASLRARPRWKVVVGARVDHNEVDALGGVVEVGGDGEAAGETLPVSGYGTVFNPRVAVIFSPGTWVLKAIYATAFKDASNFNRYALSPAVRELPNPDLDPEEVDNVELVADWRASERLTVDASIFRADYTGAVGLDAVARQNRNIGRLEIMGMQANVRWQGGEAWSVFGNYTFTDPTTINPDGTEVRTGDIARHQVNVGFDLDVRDRWRFDFRVNHVGRRKTGPGTSVPGNPFPSVDPYTVAHASVTWTAPPIEGLQLQLTVDNLFDEAYDHPGVRSARGGFAPRIPQNERSFFLRARTTF